MKRAMLNNQYFIGPVVATVRKETKKTGDDESEREV